jgi:hypothetical protein
VPNRREFLAISLASSALPMIAGEQNSNVPRVRMGSVVVEMTSPLALAFRLEAVKWGLPAHGIYDDITDLWYHNLDRQWRTDPVALAGITLSTSLFCLETFARDCGMRVRFRAIHTNRPDGRGESVLSGDERLVEEAAALDAGWAGAFARFATAAPLVEPRKSQERTVETAPLLPEEPGPMVSWIIAPRLSNQSGPIS